MTMIAGTSGDPVPLVAGVRRALREVEPSMPVDVQTLSESFSVSLYPFKLFGMVLVAEGLMAFAARDDRHLRHRVVHGGATAS